MHSDTAAEEQISLDVQGRCFVPEHPLETRQSNPQGFIVLWTHEALGASGRSFSQAALGSSVQCTKYSVLSVQKVCN